jgi:cellulose synthase/poly-beta-1,6-N-acetylglucosamine synthase-like glycosyltransferase
MNEEDYLKISKASDIKDKKKRRIYRILEIFPGSLSWFTLGTLFVLCWQRPLWVAIFAIVFDLFWLMRVIYRSFLLRTGYSRMKKHEKIDWLGKIKNLKSKNWRDYYHLLVFPMYKEPLEIVRESFAALKNSDYPKDRMIVVLTIEEKARSQALETAEIIKKEFGGLFFKFLITWHSSNLPGEIAGKGSNETWGVKKAKEEIIDPLKIPYEKIIFSSLDADTVVAPKYFSCLAFHYLTAKKPVRTSFQPIPLFINNIWQVPVLSRIFSFSSTFWNTMNQASPENLITFSSHSMSFKALVEVGFKQTNVVSDDSRIFWQCFLKFNGDYQVQPLYYPVSMDAVVAKTYFRTMVNVYKQQRRWAYGVGEIPYLLFGFLRNKKISFKKKLRFGLIAIEGHWSWATASFIIFFLGWLPLVLGGPEFSQTLFSYSLPRMLRNIMSLAMIGLISSAYLSIVLLPPKPPSYGRFKYLILALEWLVVPLVMIVFTPIPAIEAQTRLMFKKYLGFYPTEKVRK